VARAVQRRHSPGHKRRAIGHADRCGDVEIVEACAAMSEPIDIRRAQDGVAVTTQVIGAVLIRDDEEKVGSFVHGVGRSSISFITMAGRCNAFVRSFGDLYPE
jgi:hypothetical protein